MAEHKNQHYVPQYYFRWFTPDPKRISLLRKRDGEVNSGVRIQNQSSKNYYYGDKSMERRISELESMARSGLSKLRMQLERREMLRLSDEEDQLVRGAVLLQKARTLLERERLCAPLEGMVHYISELHLRAKGYGDAECKGFEVKLNEQRLQLSAISDALLAVPLIADLALVGLSNETPTPLMFGDAPVVFYNQLLRRVTGRGVLGWQTPGLQILYPLSSRTALMLIDRERYDFSSNATDLVRLTEEDVRSLNALQLHNALNCLYYGDDSHAVAKELWWSERERLEVVLGQFSPVVATVDGCDKPERELLMVHEPQLPYELQLSFLGVSPVDPEDYVVGARNPLLCEIHRHAMAEVRRHAKA